MKRLLRRPAVQTALVSVLVFYLRFALSTTRWRFEGFENLPQNRPAVLAFWHQRLAMIPALRRLARQRGFNPDVTVLASRHRDGKLLGAIMQGFGGTIVYGSTARGGQDKGGSAALRALLRALADGGIVLLTPDGPRGPAGVPAPGVAQLAALFGAPLIPCSAQLHWRIHLRSWDRMILPLPFGRGVMLCGAPILVPREGWMDTLPSLKSAIDALTARADAMAG